MVRRILERRTHRLEMSLRTGRIAPLGVKSKLPTQTALTEVQAVASTRASAEPQRLDAGPRKPGPWFGQRCSRSGSPERSSSWLDRGSKSRPCAVWSGVAGGFPTTGGSSSWQNHRRNCGCGDPSLCCKRTRDHPDDLRRVAARCCAPRFLGGLEFRETPLRAAARVGTRQAVRRSVSDGGHGCRRFLLVQSADLVRGGPVAN